MKRTQLFLILAGIASQTGCQGLNPWMTDSIGGGSTGALQARGASSDLLEPSEANNEEVVRLLSPEEIHEGNVHAQVRALKQELRNDFESFKSPPNRSSNRSESIEE